MNYSVVLIMWQLTGPCDPSPHFQFQHYVLHQHWPELPECLSVSRSVDRLTHALIYSYLCIRCLPLLEGSNTFLYIPGKLLHIHQDLSCRTSVYLFLTFFSTQVSIWLSSLSLWQNYKHVHGLYIYIIYNIYIQNYMHVYIYRIITWFIYIYLYI